MVAPLGDAILQKALGLLQELVKMYNPGGIQLQPLRYEWLSVPCSAGLHREDTHCLST